MRFNERIHEIVNYLSHTWGRLVCLGVSADMPRSLARRVKAANVVTLVLIALALPYTPLVVWLGSLRLTAILPLVAGCYGGCLWLTRRGHSLAGRLLMLVIFNCTVFIGYHSQGDVTELPVMLLCSSALPLIVFQLKERIGVAIGIGLPGIFYVLTAFNGYVPFPFLNEISAPVPRSTFTSVMMYTTAVGIVTAGIYYLNFVNDLQERELVQQQKRILDAAAKLSSLGEMAAGIGHEINNPVTTIVGWAEELAKVSQQSVVDRDKLEHGARRILEASKRVAMIVRGLRGLSRAGDGDPFRSEPVGKIIDETVAICRERLRRHGIALEVSMPPGQVLLSCRASQISQVLLNLLNNACDAVEGLSERWIRVALEESVLGVRLSVVDSGRGIPEPVRSQLATIFFTTKASGKGTGLGLSIVRRIVADHHGAFNLDEAASNTCFVIDLPKSRGVG